MTSREIPGKPPVKIHEKTPAELPGENAAGISGGISKANSVRNFRKLVIVVVLEQLVE